ncbi:MAG: hypothetical protein QOE60_720, partial [Thermoleophilaceae bacterium]|nr:hypothetical protein [Thermoleophilaceae bacterium]
MSQPHRVAFAVRAWATTQRAPVDEVAADVCARLRQAGVRAILLKGASFADWLYPDGTRVYVDVDLLVREDRARAAEALLRELGYSQLWAPEDMPADLPIASHWRRSEGGPPVDLHWALPEARADAAVQWDELTRRTERLGEIETLGEAGRCVTVALHAARHADLPKPAEDLARALRAADRSTWAEAGELARRIGALDGLSAGLRTQSAGAELADAIGVPPPRSTRAVLLTQSPPPGADGIDALFTAGGARARARLIARTLLPTPRWMRSSTTLGRRGGAAWLVVAYS